MSTATLAVSGSTAFVVVLSLFLCYFKMSYYEHSFPQILCSLLFAAICGFAAVLLCSFALDILRHPTEISTPSMSLLGAGAIGAMFSRIVNIAIRKSNNIITVDRNDISEMRDQMTVEERLHHAHECPFRSEHIELLTLEGIIKEQKKSQ